MRHFLAIALAVGLIPVGSAYSQRVDDGLLLLIDFKATSGPVSGVDGNGKRVDLRVQSEQRVFRSAGSLELLEPTVIRSSGNVDPLIREARQRPELSLEVWLRSRGVGQDGPARIVTISRNTSERNLTLGQDGDKFDVRLRTRKTSKNGLPSTSTASRMVTTNVVHVVYTQAADGTTRIYVDGEVQGRGKVVPDKSNWATGYGLALANEFTGDRPWLGTLYLVAVYGKNLSAAEVKRNFAAGPGSQVLPPRIAKLPAPQKKPGKPTAKPPRSLSSRLFDESVANILRKRCLECHNETVRKGRLDLSSLAAARRGGSNGAALSPGDLTESLLWTYIEADEMPKNRQKLTDRERGLVRQWIQTGAEWTVPSLGTGETERKRERWVRRLTVSEYVATVRDTLGVDVGKLAQDRLPAELRADGFSNTAYNLTVDFEHIAAYADLSRQIVRQVDLRRLVAQYTSAKFSEDDLRRLVAQEGERLWRGPLEEREINGMLAIAKQVKVAGGDDLSAVRFVLEAMLQSPRFLYRVERQSGQLSDFEIAARLSYSIWGSSPDDALFKAARDGQLQDTEKLRQHIRRMLTDGRAKTRSGDFIYQWLDLGRLDNLRPSKTRFPDWNPALAEDMKQETLRYFYYVAWEEKRSLAALLNTKTTFLTPRLAKHYNIPAEESPAGRYDLASVPSRGGLLTQGSVLTVGGDEASMVARGLFVLHDLLRGSVGDPPACVDTTPVPSKPGMSQRKIAQARISNSACGSCHQQFEPLAFGLERFDGLGTYREIDEHGNALRDDGTLTFPGSEQRFRYATSAQLMDLLATSDRVQETLTWKLTQFVVGRPLLASDRPVVQAIHRQAKQAGATYSATLEAILLSDLVRQP